jgi:hypothetical protein
MFTLLNWPCQYLTRGVADLTGELNNWQIKIKSNAISARTSPLIELDPNVTILYDQKTTNYWR